MNWNQIDNAVRVLMADARGELRREPAWYRGAQLGFNLYEYYRQRSGARRIIRRLINQVVPTT